MIQFFPALVWKDDLLEAEGVPLISYFRSVDSDEPDYLRFWFDVEDGDETWLYFEISVHDLVKFKSGRMTALEVWKAAPQIIREITDRGGNHLSFEQIKLSDIPQQLHPSDDSFYDPNFTM